MNVPNVENGWQLAALALVILSNLGTLVMTYLISRSQISLSQKQDSLQKTQQEIHVLTNSQTAALIEVSKIAAKAIGRQEGVAQERELARNLLAQQSAAAAPSEIDADPPRTSPAPKISPIEYHLGGGEKKI